MPTCPGVDPSQRRRRRRGPGADHQRRAHPAQQSRAPPGWPASAAAAQYLRRLNLGQGIDTAAISASYENGVLSVVLPVSEKAKARKVEVQTATALAVDAA